jgi:SAM-dependent methyltransferase
MNEHAHRKRKRNIEMNIIVEQLKLFITESESNNILEFGCGDGFQIPFLKSLSENLVAIDININNELKCLYPNIVNNLSINSTNFNDKQFNLIFSNHVIEHLVDLKGAVREMHRIGTDECLYVFSVPTNIWLLLSIPAQYYRKINYIIEKNKIKIPFDETNSKNKEPIKERGVFINRLLPKGHGVYTRFQDCYNAFKIKTWQSLFSELGFNIIKIKPLLLYSASELPIIPTTRILNKFGVCSSVLFIMSKKLIENK